MVLPTEGALLQCLPRASGKPGHYYVTVEQEARGDDGTVRDDIRLQKVDPGDKVTVLEFGVGVGSVVGKIRGLEPAGPYVGQAGAITST